MKEEYQIKFDRNNSNIIIISKDDKFINWIACPPIKNGCDLINFGAIINKGYTYDYDGVVIITNEKERLLYHKGNLIDKIKRQICYKKK